MTKQAWPQPCASERMDWAGTGYLHISHLLSQQHCPAQRKAERITQGFACHESYWDTKLKKRQRLPAVATRMQRASVFICTIQNNAITPPQTSQSQIGGQEITEKGHGNNQIHIKKWLSKQYPPKTPFTRKLTEESTWWSLKNPEGVKWKNGKFRPCQCH